MKIFLVDFLLHESMTSDFISYNPKKNHYARRQSGDWCGDFIGYWGYEDKDFLMPLFWLWNNQTFILLYLLEIIEIINDNKWFFKHLDYAGTKLPSFHWNMFPAKFSVNFKDKICQQIPFLRIIFCDINLIARTILGKFLKFYGYFLKIYGFKITNYFCFFDFYHFRVFQKSLAIHFTMIKSIVIFHD